MSPFYRFQSEDEQLVNELRAVVGGSKSITAADLKRATAAGGKTEAKGAAVNGENWGCLYNSPHKDPAMGIST